MCGIVAIYNKREDVYSEEANSRYCQKMTNKLRSRGPDEINVINLGRICLGHTRLSIIDIEKGSQPIFNEKRTVCTILNGEIYNYNTLKKLLLNRGHFFQTNSDTEVIVHLYEEFGEEFIEKLDGMFAFVLYDIQNEILLIGRDRIGEKPVVYYQDRNIFIVASEIKAIIEHPDVKNTVSVSQEALSLYFNSLYIPAPYTIYDKIKKLSPSHYIKIQRDKFQIKKYWHPQIKIDWSLTEDDIKKKLIELYTKSVKSRMHADVPLGVFLSGGLDSSITTAFMAMQTSNKIKTFTVGFSDEFDEREYAKTVSDRYNTQHKEIFIKSNIEESFREIMSYYDEPFADPSSIPTYLISRAARRHVKVILSGDGADELFGGYTTYVWQKYAMYNKIFNGMFRRTNQLIINKFNMDLTPWVYPKNSTKFDKNDWINKRSYYSKMEIDKLLIKPKTFSLNNFFHNNKWFELPFNDPLSRAFEHDVNYYLPDDLFKKVDMASMCCGLETRAPFLDPKIVEFALSIPPYLKLKNDITKSVFRNSFKEFLPLKVINRKKMGFGAPTVSWMRNQLKEMLMDLLSSNSRIEEYVDPKIIQESIKNVIYSKGELNFGVPSKLWSLFIFEWWLRKYD